jgi:anti-sigma B factor antagonist
MQPGSTIKNASGDRFPRLRSKETKLKLSLETRQLGDVIIVHCEGRIVYRDEAAALTRVVAEALEHTREVILDLEGVERIDSAGLGELVLIRLSAEANGSHLKLAAPNARVRALLDLTKLSSVLDVHDSLVEALEAGDEMPRLA